MTRFLLKIEYDGRPYVGWQKQDNGLGVQEVIEKAVIAYSQDASTVIAAGRTDAGVHARGMHAHVDISRPSTGSEVCKALNALMRPAPVAILAAQPVADDFSARFSCIGRSYLYRIINRRAPLTFNKGLAWNVFRTLSVDAMQEAANHLIGKHDFTSFRAASCQAKSPLKTIDRIKVYREGDEIFIEAEAPSFLQHQIRNFAGSLVKVGDGRWHPEEIKRILEAKDRAEAGETAPPDGLYFMDAHYKNVNFDQS